jgi:hypothetical protein
MNTKSRMMLLTAACCLSWGMSGAAVEAQSAAQERSLTALAPYDYYVRHAGFRGFISKVKKKLDSKDARFLVHSSWGKYGARCVTLESINYRDHYLRHAFWRVVLSNRVDERRYWEDATFCMVPPLWNPQSWKDGYFSLRSFNAPDRYVRHRNFEVWVDTFEDTSQFRRDAVFRFTPPKEAPTLIDYENAVPADE